MSKLYSTLFLCPFCSNPCEVHWDCTCGAKAINQVFWTNPEVPVMQKDGNPSPMVADLEIKHVPVPPPDERWQKLADAVVGLSPHIKETWYTLKVGGSLLLFTLMLAFSAKAVDTNRIYYIGLTVNLTNTAGKEFHHIELQYADKDNVIYAVEGGGGAIPLYTLAPPILQALMIPTNWATISAQHKANRDSAWQVKQAHDAAEKAESDRLKAEQDAKAKQEMESKLRAGQAARQSHMILHARPDPYNTRGQLGL